MTYNHSCTVTSLVFQTSHFPLTACLLFFLSSFSLFIYHHSPRSSLHLPGQLSTLSVFWTVPLWPLCVPCKLLSLSFSPFLIGLFLLLCLLISSRFFTHIPDTLICINAAPWCFSLILHFPSAGGQRTCWLCFIDYFTAFLEWCTQLL